MKSLGEHMDKLERLVANRPTKEYLDNALTGVKTALQESIEAAKEELKADDKETRKMVLGRANPPVRD